MVLASVEVSVTVVIAVEAYSGAVLPIDGKGISEAMDPSLPVCPVELGPLGGGEMTKSDLIGVSMYMTLSISSAISSSIVSKESDEFIPIISPCKMVGAKSLSAILDEAVESALLKSVSVSRLIDDCDVSSAVRAGPISCNVRLMRLDSSPSPRSDTGDRSIPPLAISTGIGGKSLPSAIIREIRETSSDIRKVGRSDRRE